MELLVSSKLAHSNIPSSMEFHGTAHVIVIGALQVPWNSMGLLMSENGALGTFLSSMELHGIPWNLINFIFKKIIFLNIVFVI